MRLLVSLLTLLVSSSLFAQARVSFTPAAPTDAQPISIRVSDVNPTTAVPGCPQVTVIGSRIHVITTCGGGVGGAVPTPFSFEVSAGPLPAGRYEVFYPSQLNAPPVALTSITVREAAPAFRVIPDVASGDGVEEVRIVGVNVGTGAPVVRFGDSMGTVTSIVSANEIVARLPPRGPGIVDVTVNSGAATSTSRAAFQFFDRSGERDPAFFEPVMFPVIFNGAGPFGAQWDTEVTLHNANDYFVTAPGNIFTTFCFPGCDPRPAPRSSIIVLGQHRPDGRIEYFPRQAMPRLNFNINVRDLSRGDLNLGSEVPVLREDDLYDRAFAISNIPVDRRYRISLRVYDTAGPSSVRLRIHKVNTETPFVDEVVQLSPNLDSGAATFMIGDLVGVHPQLAGRGPLRIDIAPLAEPTSRSLWGMVSITNNETNQVTIVSPH
ncbi:MAG TPA: IPT/TIG domain-containing protein [Thermoanaerobaculia bacterium]|nr:IPT/TIG domain-containing protein [Thermoanaerobaculia bacterium]